MKEYLAERLLSIAYGLCQCGIIGIIKARHNEELDSKDHKVIGAHLTIIAHELEFLGLNLTRASVLRTASKITTLKTDGLAQELDIIQGRLSDEIGALHLFYVPSDRIGFYNKTDLFGEEFKTNFPTANGEIIEAGNCFAFDRFSATVFHLTRALEISLRVLFTSLGMPARIWSVTRWHRILQRIDGKIKRNNERLANDNDWKRDRSFYEKAHAFLAAAANPLRNSSVHVDVVYSDESSVRPIWLATEAFMRHLATKLKE